MSHIPRELHTQLWNLGINSHARDYRLNRYAINDEAAARAALGILQQAPNAFQEAYAAGEIVSFPGAVRGQPSRSLDLSSFPAGWVGPAYGSPGGVTGEDVMAGMGGGGAGGSQLSLGGLGPLLLLLGLGWAVSRGR